MDYAYDQAGTRISASVDGALQSKWTWDTANPLPVRINETNGAGATTHQWANDPMSGLASTFVDTQGATPS